MSTTPAFAVRIWSAIGHAFAVYGRQWPVFIGLVVMGNFLNFIIAWLRQQAAATGATPLPTLLVIPLYLIGIVVSMWCYLAMYIASDRILQQTPASFAQNLRAVRGKFWRYVGVTLFVVLLMMAIMFGGMLPAIIMRALVGNAAQPTASPGALVMAIVATLAMAAMIAALLYLMVRLSLYPIVIAVEPRGATGALRRSRALTRGAFWRTLGVCVALGLCFAPAIVLMLLAMNVQDQTIRNWPLYIAGQVVSLGLNPLIMIAGVIWYHALKARQEAGTSTTTT